MPDYGKFTVLLKLPFIRDILDRLCKAMDAEHPGYTNTNIALLPLWRFQQPGTVRRKLIQRAGRLTRPQGKTTLRMSANPIVKSGLLHYLEVLKHTA